MADWLDIDSDLTGELVGREGRLRLRAPLGTGGAGIIWKAEDTQTHRPVAVKFLRTRDPSPEQRERFVREGRIFGKIRHPNLVEVYWLGQHRGCLYLALEFVDGLDLYDHLHEYGAFDLRDGLSIAGAIASGLEKAHSVNVIHRDLKPSNVMIRSIDGVVKVLDFGIAKDLDASTQLTQMGIYVGTPAYSAPEQIRGDPVDARTDIFSLGVILYEVLTGPVDFAGRHSTEVMRSTLKQERVPLKSLYDQVAGPVARFIHRCTRKDPARRPSSMAEVQEECTRLLAIVEERGLDRQEQDQVTGLLRQYLEE